MNLPQPLRKLSCSTGHCPIGANNFESSLRRFSGFEMAVIFRNFSLCWSVYVKWGVLWTAWASNSGGRHISGSFRHSPWIHSGKLAPLIWCGQSAPGSRESLHKFGKEIPKNWHQVWGRLVLNKERGTSSSGLTALVDARFGDLSHWPRLQFRLGEGTEAHKAHFCWFAGGTFN